MARNAMLIAQINDIPDLDFANVCNESFASALENYAPNTSMSLLNDPSLWYILFFN